ncbi:uncharacterized protein LOC120632901 [Pararge aegeria]|uniref:uncharacterized protein LOC120632901 n=1 Tax=Pararge aegeria TaxID=116150 RepID=UPI0019CF8661|nr:uncharacterized protein LOC120632901 [Pararge aegeria]
MVSKVVLKVCCLIFFCGLVALLWSETTKNLNSFEVYNETSTNGSVNEARKRTLSRSKRFLVFPEGSSLQLVFCVQTSALIPIGDIFLYGNTAALAWNLPTDPKLLLMLKEYEKTAKRRVDESNVYYVDDKGKLIAKVPYKRRTIINPAFAKRSVSDKTSFKEKLKIKIDRLQMHKRQLQREYLKKNNFDRDSIEFHRHSRVDLYEKLAPFITALGGDGPQCVLRKLCETAKASTRQGTFLQEMLRVVFTLPKGTQFQSEDHRGYDKAHSVRDDCASMYPALFCAQNQGYLQLGDIVWFGNTAALAWELPTDPELLLKLKKHDKLSYTAQNRDGVSKLLYYLDEKGNVLSKVPYRKKIIVNPAFAKRSVDEHLADLDELSVTTIKELHIKQKSLRVFDDLDENAVNFHRRGRQSLYGQLETFIQAIGWTGRECVLRLLCESGKGSADQGTFLEEIFRATFTLPKRRKSDGDLYRDYDEAHNAKGDCPSLYPQCKQTVKKYI